MKACSAALAALLCAAPPALAADIEVEGSVCRMTLRAEDEPLTNVLAAIASRTGVEIEARGALDRRVSVKLIDRSVDEVLDRLGLGFVRMCASEGDPGRVVGGTAARAEPQPGLILMRIDAGAIAPGGEFSLTWPAGLPPAAEATLSAFLGEVLDRHLPTNRPLPGATHPARLVGSFAEAFQREYDDFKRAFPDSALTYEARISTAVHRRDAEILSLVVNYWDYTGGAHGNYDTRNAVIDLRSGKRLACADLFLPDSEERLTALIEEELRLGKRLPPGASLKEAGFWEEDIGPNDNVFVSQAGVGFHYNPYDIGPFVAGSFSPVIPFEKLRGLLLPDIRRRLLPPE